MKNIRTLKQLVAIVLTILLLFSILTTALIFSSNRHISDSHIRAVGGATLDYYQSQLETILERAATYAQNTIPLNVSALRQAATPTDRHVDKLALGSSLSNLLSISDNLYFAMADTYAEDASFPVIRSRCSSMAHSDAIFEALSGMVKEVTLAVGQDDWIWLEIDGAHYLTRFFLSADAYTVVCVSSSVLTMAAENEDSLYLFCRQDGMNIAGSSVVQEALAMEPDAWEELDVNGQSYCLLTNDSLQGEFTIHCLVPISTSALGSYFMQQTGVLLLFCMAILFCFALLVRGANGTFSTLNQACEQVSQGDLSTEITRKGRFAEEVQIYTAFNGMIRQIKALRIDLYEQSLHAHRSKMGFLRMQIKSHFFVNCLTVIHSLAMVGDMALVQEFALCLADYFRYLGSGFSDTVRFGSELEHLHNFVHIHQIRYPDRITYHYSVDNELLDFPVLPMIPQTFVENVFKHAMGVIRNIALTIRAYAAEGGMWLEIRDDGPGFTEEQLVSLNAPYEPNAEVSGSGTGVANTRERLHLFYHGRSQVIFENHPEGGAVVRVFFPANEEREAIS